MRPGVVLLASTTMLVAADATAQMLLGTHVTGGPHQAVRPVVCVAAAFLIARQGTQAANLIRAPLAALLAAALATFTSTAVYVLDGGAVAHRHGPELLLGFMQAASAVGLASGLLGAAAGYFRARTAAEPIVAADIGP